ncbi:MAG: hypothetical protein HC911_12590 [Chloroflexaceae bacterium]|nr:hypothetical protein [Chloroflexaceae bacterium]
MEPIPIYLQLSDELQAAFADNKLDIAEILHKNGIDASVQYGELLLQNETGVRSKDLVTIIVASSVLLPSIAFSISQVLNVIYNRPHLVEYEELEELRDGDGNVMLDNYGKPLFKPVKRVERVSGANRASFEVQLNPTNGLRIKFSTKQGSE